MDAVIFSINIQLGENNAVLSVKSAVGNPVLVRELGRAVDSDRVVFFDDHLHIIARSSRSDDYLFRAYGAIHRAPTTQYVAHEGLHLNLVG